MSKIELLNVDCMEFMRGLPDKAFDLTLCVIDKDYFEAGKKRLEQHQSQPRMFEPEPRKVHQQLTIGTE